MTRNLRTSLLSFLATFFAIGLSAQCLNINCPSNITVNTNTGTCAAVATYTPPVGTNSCGGGTGSQTFNYTGGVQTFVVPPGITAVTVDAQGAQGGGPLGGRGGRAVATIVTTPGETLNIYVGGQPAARNSPPGYNGGGALTAWPCGTGGTSNSYPGGGASDVRRGTSLSNRIVVAGGGGGQGWSNGFGGAGGGTSGSNGDDSWIANTNGKGATSSSGGLGGVYSGSANSNPAVQNGAFGQGGGGYPVGTYCTGGGGGGGWYGGGGGFVSAGGGGSSYVSFAGNTSTSTTSGFRTGNGQVILSWNGGAGTANTTRTAGLGTGANFPVGVTTETYTVSDGQGGSTSCSFTVTGVDNQTPSITCPANVTASTSGSTCSAVVNYTAPTGTDNCSGATTNRTAGLGSGASFPVGATTETYTVTDGAGLTNTCSFTVTVTDGTPPSITCPADITQPAGPSACSAGVSYAVPSGTDNCSGASTIRTAGLGSAQVFPVGTTTETYTVTDGAGLTSSCSFTVTITDTTQPSITCPANVSLSADSGSCSTTYTYSAPQGTDNCGVPTTTQTAGLGSGATYPVGFSVETWQATDASGNTTTCTFVVAVDDDEDPVITCPADITVNNDPGQCGAVVTYAQVTGTDNCSGASTQQIAGLGSGATFPIGTTTETYQATDADGNTSDCSFDVTVQSTYNSSQTLDECNGFSITVGSNTYTSSGTYTDTLTSSAGCDSVVTTNLTVAAPIDVTTSVNVAVITANATGATYQWWDCDSNSDITGETGQSYTATQPGNYAVIVTVGTCSDTSACVNLTIDGIEEENFGSGFTLFPNPTSGKFQIDFDRNLQNAQIRIYDVTSREVLKVDEVNGTSILLDLGHLAKGTYYARIQEEKRLKVLKVVVE